MHLELLLCWLMKTDRLRQKRLPKKTIFRTLKILRKIVQAGIIKSYRGVNGGYVLNKKPSEITLKDVIETIDGKIAINKCMENPESCKNNGICKVQRKLYKVQKVLADEMSKITFQDVLEGK